MNDVSIASTHRDTAARPRDRRLRIGLTMARLIRAGRLTLALPDGSVHEFDGGEPGSSATIIVRDPRMVTRLAFGGTLGLAEAYLDGWWESPSLIDVLRLGTENEHAWSEMMGGSRWTRIVNAIAHRLRPNSRHGAKRNIATHYDLGNDFYAAWQDETMTYSAALFDGGHNDLAAAQRAKIHRLCLALDLRPGMRVLEIGCGWGSFAEIAAGDYGVDVTGITLSEAQFAHARARIADAGLKDKVTIRQQDYRDVSERFDAIASIEMFEAVGEAYWPVFFAKLRESLAPEGRAALQVITIADQYFEGYRQGADFIQRHVFPGGMLPSPRRFGEEVARAALTLQEKFWFGYHYAETLSRWQHAFQDAWPRIAHQAPPVHGKARFKRLWEFYLAYCETGFSAGWTDVGQFVIEHA